MGLRFVLYTYAYAQKKSCFCHFQWKQVNETLVSHLVSPNLSPPRPIHLKEQTSRQYSIAAREFLRNGAANSPGSKTQFKKKWAPNMCDAAGVVMDAEMMSLHSSRLPSTRVKRKRDNSVLIAVCLIDEQRLLTCHPWSIWRIKNLLTTVEPRFGGGSVIIPKPERLFFNPRSFFLTVVSMTWRILYKTRVLTRHSSYSC